MLDESRTEWGRKAVITFEATVEVLHEVQIDSPDVTIVKGGGAEVDEWAKPNGFDIYPSTPEILDFYGEGSPYFMAARLDAAAARELNRDLATDLPGHVPSPGTGFRPRHGSGCFGSHPVEELRNGRCG